MFIYDQENIRLLQHGINQSNSEVNSIALKTTLLIIIYSLPFLVCLSLPIIIFRDKFVGFWLKSTRLLSI
ncbi:hypothetical protein CK516_36850 [Nostoc sp. 'Peltigera malacea cyanobiont' DB3992]|nr:hypothetical protein CK516_36850 [Nostoc sp. 'Peltigera malacea cyanobiont' DB3992]